MVYLSHCSESLETISYLVRVWFFQVLNGFRALFRLELIISHCYFTQWSINYLFFFFSLVGRKRPFTLQASGTVSFYHFGLFFSQWPWRSVLRLEWGCHPPSISSTHTAQLSPLSSPVLGTRLLSLPVAQDSHLCLLNPECPMGSNWVPSPCAMAWKLVRGCKLRQSETTPRLCWLSDYWPDALCLKNHGFV